MNPSAPSDRVAVVLNPASGSTDGAVRRRRIERFLAERGVEAHWLDTDRADHTADRVRQWVASGGSRVWVSGGDGTVRQVLAGTVGTRAVVAILPAGTGNLLARNLGIPLGLPEALEVAFAGHARAIDLARTSEGELFALMGGIGLDGQVMASTDRLAKGRFGVLAYVWATLRHIRRRRLRARLILDHRVRLRRRATSILIANLGKIGPGVEAVPGASADDGELDIGIVKSHTPWQWFRLLASLARGRIADDPAMEIHRATSVEIVVARPEPVELDGEALGQRVRLAVTVLPRAARVMVPGASGAGSGARADG
ncbi:MAG: diacylglycerol/lipid kinase family protein [Armatimonadota bacterium]